MSTLDCDSTTRLNTSRTWDGRTDSKNSNTSSELLQGTLVQATEQPKHHANPTTTVQPLARRLSQRRQHYLSQDQTLQVSAVALSTPEPAHHWAITTTIPAEVPPVIPRDLEGRLQPLYNSTGPLHGGDRLSPLANFLNGCAPHNNSVSGTLR